MDIGHMTRDELRKDNERYSDSFTSVTPPGYPLAAVTKKPGRVFRSRDFLVQVFDETEGRIRLSICRTEVDLDRKRWADGITWDQIQTIKSQLGYGGRDAVEVYPADRDIVDIANIRHLWILPEPLSWVWRRKRNE